MSLFDRVSSLHEAKRIAVVTRPATGRPVSQRRSAVIPKDAQPRHFFHQQFQHEGIGSALSSAGSAVKRWLTPAPAAPHPLHTIKSWPPESARGQRAAAKKRAATGQVGMAGIRQRQSGSSAPASLAHPSAPDPLAGRQTQVTGAAPPRPRLASTAASTPKPGLASTAVSVAKRSTSPSRVRPGGSYTSAEHQASGLHAQLNPPGVKKRTPVHIQQASSGSVFATIQKHPTAKHIKTLEQALSRFRALPLEEGTAKLGRHLASVEKRKGWAHPSAQRLSTKLGHQQAARIPAKSKWQKAYATPASKARDDADKRANASWADYKADKGSS